MADLWRRYLAQQIELGGTEIVLGATRPRPLIEIAPQIEPEAASEPENDMSKKLSARLSVAPEAEAGGAKQQGAAPKWMKSAPPIPGPGLTVTSEAASPRKDLQALKTLDAIADHIRASSCCGLCATRTNAVPGEGNPHAKFVLIGEGPGATEDATGRPFVGQAGQLLDGILDAIELPRETVYITNIVKCRPPQNRKPTPEESAACLPYLHRQLDLLRPKVILLLGSTAAETLLGAKKSLGELRGKVHTYNGIPVVVTYHPAALLRNPNWKKPTWDDVRIARQLLDR